MAHPNQTQPPLVPAFITRKQNEIHRCRLIQREEMIKSIVEKMQYNNSVVDCIDEFTLYMEEQY